MTWHFGDLVKPRRGLSAAYDAVAIMFIAFDGPTFFSAIGFIEDGGSDGIIRRLTVSKWMLA